MKVFIDMNVLLDVLAQREPFYDDGLAIWSLAEHGRIEGIISAISFNNLYYLIERMATAGKARKAMHMLRDTFSVIALDERILHQAIDADIKDFEDGIQFFSALRARAIVTRNPKDFPAGEITVQTPSEFLATHFPSPQDRGG